MKVAENIKCFRESIGLSQGDFAKAIGTSKQAVSNWECGRTVPSDEFKIRMHVEYDAPYELFFDEAVN